MKWQLIKRKETRIRSKYEGDVDVVAQYVVY